ncbi:hypothetical protein SYNPS1DRAFT_23682 [Syncephalis pseudoplumigaleata]|uniref:Actin-domain-containing protein n=1 Tax=Syncephalis pseudoplumigaleata TaxID=1712513 RepID=A0A4P9YWC8_9FUNG|nr:hypothetical protein SYNPS1DRAFT_23682 [Syncephalis pseudoplumigaleata]|eukprot:RKP24224.1 hypothetical protein SYNPS1DRAFT_23682 [Syncephalis pseudoplumigaleata]
MIKLSSSIMAGWSGEANPQTCFPTIIAKYRDRRLSSKNLVLELTLDNVFLKLGINDSRVNHPLLLTEPICTPNGSRKIMSELAFECYGAPSVSYGVDALFSYYQNGHSMERGGIVCSMGHAATHILPIVDGRGLFSADDYMEEERKYADEATFHKLNHTIQFPFTVAKASEEKTEEEVAAANERRRAHLVRLQELAAKSRQEKNEARELELQRLRNVRETCYGLEEDDLEVMYLAGGHQALLAENQFESLDDLDAEIDKLDQAVKRAQQRKTDGTTTELHHP